MTRNQKKRENESFPDWVNRLFPLWSKEQKDLVCEMLKTAYIKGSNDTTEIVLKMK